MFCDLVGSTKLSARLDPEDLREVMRDYQKVRPGAAGLARL
jgi:class 3 adenylate cyclase